jgi:pimeloyl-ACP methyl ester carboxylesterase
MRRGTRIAASLIVMAAAVPASGAAAGPEGGAPAAAALARLARCSDDRSARCGSLRVPVYRGVRGSGHLTIRFRVYPRTDRSRPALEPIVTVEGGPGYPSIGSADYYLFMLGRLRARHDVIVMDNRGTGSSGAINCPRLQEGEGVYAREVGRCARKLGRRANAFGTGAAADDLAAVLDKLRVPVVDVYGDSYGTYFAQSFAVRHPQRVRAVVLDAAFGVDYFDFWTRQESRALSLAWPAVCARSTGCGGDVLAQLRDWAVRLERRPIRGVSRDADGGRHRVKLDGANLGQMAGDASYYYSLYRDLSAALRAAGRGDRAPLLRLAAEDLPFTGGGPVKEYSEGAYAAVACHDYPVVWDTAAPLATRRAQLAAARATLEPDAFAPFPSEIWLRSLYVNQLVTGCLRWPQPAHPDPPVPPGATYPTVPVLVLVGDIDAITPLEDSQRAASLFGNSTLVTVSNVNHVTALADFNGCASGIVRRFLRTLSAGDTSCAARVPEVHVVPEFPRRLAQAPAATATQGDRSSARDRRVAWAAAWTAGDALARWWLMYGEDGHGLRGGRFTASGDYLAYVPIELRLRATRFVEDLPVSGTLTWDRRARRVTARLRVHGGTLRVAWSATAARAIASVRGTLGGRAVRLQTPAP